MTCNIPSVGFISAYSSYAKLKIGYDIDSTFRQFLGGEDLCDSNLSPIRQRRESSQDYEISLATSSAVNVAALGLRLIRRSLHINKSQDRINTSSTASAASTWTNFALMLIFIDKLSVALLALLARSGNSIWKVWLELD